MIVPPGLRKFARRIFEAGFFGWARYLFVSRLARKLTGEINLTARVSGLQLLSSDVLAAIRRTKQDAHTAFILGTGASVLTLDEEKFAAIESQFSIGVNQWVFHTFIPDVYSYEADPDPSLLDKLQRTEIAESQPYVLALAPKLRVTRGHFDRVRDSMRSRFFLYGRVNLMTRVIRNAGRDFLIASDRFERFDSPIILPDNGASVARLVSLCYRLGFKKIVLVGVDLNNVRYFWHEEPNFLTRLGLDYFPTYQTGVIHETMSSAGRQMKIDEFFSSVGKALLDAGVSLEIESARSALSSSLPVYNWGEMLSSSG